MTHKTIPAERRKAAGVADSLIRLSTGLEDAEDLIEDLRQALDKTAARGTGDVKGAVKKVTADVTEAVSA
jgi:cystathionine beta-lyase